MRYIEITKEQLDRLHDYWEVFGTEKGQRVIEDMRKSYGQTPYTKGDSYDTHVKIGKYHVLEDIEDIMRMRNLEIKIREEED